MSILRIYFWLCWVFVAAPRFSLVKKISRGYSPAVVRCFSLQCLLLWWSMGSSVGELQYLPNTGLVAPWHMVSSPTRIEPVSPALVGGFLTTESLGKSSILLFNQLNIWWKLMFVMPKVFLTLLYSLYYTCTHHYIVALNHLIAQHIGDFYLWWFFSSHGFGTNILFMAGMVMQVRGRL